MMKEKLLVVLLGALPLVSLAGGGHEGGHSHGGSHSMTHGTGSGHAHGSEEGGHKAPAGRPGDPDRVDRTVEVVMEDSMRFIPGDLTFRSGETVRFVVRNHGKIRHEMVIGSVEELREHAEMMRRSPGMKHSDPNMVSLAPGEESELVWTFENPGSFDFACLVPGHLEAGMKGKIDVN